MKIVIKNRQKSDKIEIADAARSIVNLKTIIVARKGELVYLLKKIFPNCRGEGWALTDLTTNSVVYSEHKKLENLFEYLIDSGYEVVMFDNSIEAAGYIYAGSL